MSLCSMNDATTAVCTFTFYTSFFEYFVLEGASTGKALAVKISLKAFVSALKSNRTTERLTLSFVQEGSRHVVVFSSQCKGGLVKTHQLHYEDTGVVQAIFNKIEAKNRIGARTELFQKAIGFIFGSEEASICVDPQSGMVIRSHFQHVDKSSEFSTLKTEIAIAVDEVDSFAVNPEKNTEIAFSLRELKALLHFCELSDVSQLAFFFNGPGEPFLFSTDTTDSDTTAFGSGDGGPINTFKAELIVATLETEEIDPDEPEPEPMLGGSVDAHPHRSERDPNESALPRTTNGPSEERSPMSVRQLAKQSNSDNDNDNDNDSNDMEMEDNTTPPPQLASRRAGKKKRRYSTASSD
eukprot:CAMPEP_0184536570 /NCGR_PEP_ID=MMETSP0198_2-20121128/16505_1 /TAXON_ID=1112570 /ORGANISM="Thraustochytrium sp., Strain LLF1b" /LENGTH=352 /DNA_ID=CAMNT_0026929711 /DNA_START=286 /DNA_END=1344 /DNA_ORIENTATION=+